MHNILHEKNGLVYRIVHEDNNGINIHDSNTQYGAFVGYANTNTTPITIRIDRCYESRQDEILDYMGDLLDIYYGRSWRVNGYNLNVA